METIIVLKRTIVKILLRFFDKHMKKEAGCFQRFGDRMNSIRIIGKRRNLLQSLSLLTNLLAK